jgi:hypothetical protein
MSGAPAPRQGLSQAAIPSSTKVAIQKPSALRRRAGGVGGVAGAGVPRAITRSRPAPTAVRKIQPVAPPSKPTKTGAATRRGTNGERATPPEAQMHQPTTMRFRNRTVASAAPAGNPLKWIPPGPKTGCQRGARGAEKKRSPVETIRKGRSTAPHHAPWGPRGAYGGSVPTQRIARMKNWRIIGATTGAAAIATAGVGMT